MNAKLLWAVPVIALSGGAAVAESSVTLYGVVDMGIGSTHAREADGVRQKKTGTISGGLSDTLLGLKGQEGLSDGWSATFQLETMFDGSTGNYNDEDRLFDNAAWVGLANESYGELRLGRQHPVSQELGGELEVASWKDMGMGATFKASDNHSVNNAVNYFSPSWGGLRLGLGYSFDVVGDQLNGSKLPSYSAGLLYEQGPLLLAATWDKTQLKNSGLEDARDPQTWQVGGSYDFEVAKVSVAWSRQKNGYAGLNGGDPSGLGLGLGAAEFAYGGHLDAYLLGVAVPVGGKGSVVAQWSLVKPDWSWADGEKARNGQVATLGYVYSVSPRTNLYAMAGLARRYSLDDQVVQGQGTTTRYMAGINHSF